MLIDDAHLHVWYFGYDGYWKASGHEGDYGLVRSRAQAIATACDASLARDQGTRRVVVHDWRGRPVLTITKVRGEPSSQLFQDEGDIE